MSRAEKPVFWKNRHAINLYDVILHHTAKRVVFQTKKDAIFKTTRVPSYKKTVLITRASRVEENPIMLVRCA